MTARTPVASTVHEPLGRPDGPGLFHVKGLQLPAYVQHIAKHLIAQGKTRSQAIQMAIGIVKNWAEGKGGVHPDVKAAAVKAVAEWEAAKAKAHALSNEGEAIELAYRYRHGWVLLGPGEERETSSMTKVELTKARAHHSKAALAVDMTTEAGRAESAEHLKAAKAAKAALSGSKAAPKKKAGPTGPSLLPKGADLRRNGFRSAQNLSNRQEAVELSVPARLRVAARAKAAKKGDALSDGSFPIRNKAELQDAKRAVGRANPGKRAKVKAFINKRAKQLGGKPLDMSNPVELAAPKPGQRYRHGWIPIGGKAGPRDTNPERSYTREKRSAVRLTNKAQKSGEAGDHGAAGDAHRMAAETAPDAATRRAHQLRALKHYKQAGRGPVQRTANMLPGGTSKNRQGSLGSGAVARELRGKKSTGLSNEVELAVGPSPLREGQRYRHGWIPIGTQVHTPHGRGTVVNANETHARVRLDVAPGKKSGDKTQDFHKDYVHHGSGAKVRAEKQRERMLAFGQAKDKAEANHAAKLADAIKRHRAEAKGTK